MGEIKLTQDWPYYFYPGSRLFLKKLDLGNRLYIFPSFEGKLISTLPIVENMGRGCMICLGGLLPCNIAHNTARCGFLKILALLFGNKLLCARSPCLSDTGNDRVEIWDWYNRWWLTNNDPSDSQYGSKVGRSDFHVITKCSLKVREKEVKKMAITAGKLTLNFICK